MDSTLFLIGRILFGGFFVAMGFNHLTKTKIIAGIAKAKKIPVPTTSVLVSGFMLIVGGVGIIFGIYVQWAVLLLIAFLTPAALLIHNFWAVSEEEKIVQMLLFTRNIALIGAALMAITAFK